MPMQAMRRIASVLPESGSALSVLMAGLLGILAFVAAWLVVAVFAGRAGWMALAAAPNAIAWVRASALPAGNRRALATVAMAAVSLAAGEWVVASLPLAAAMAQFPVSAALRVGPDFGWALIRLGNSPLDWCWMVLALALAAWFGR